MLDHLIHFCSFRKTDGGARAHIIDRKLCFHIDQIVQNHSCHPGSRHSGVRWMMNHAKCVVDSWVSSNQPHWNRIHFPFEQACIQICKHFVICHPFNLGVLWMDDKVFLNMRTPCWIKRGIAKDPVVLKGPHKEHFLPCHGGHPSGYVSHIHKNSREGRSFSISCFHCCDLPSVFYRFLHGIDNSRHRKIKPAFREMFFL